MTKTSPKRRTRRDTSGQPALTPRPDARPVLVGTDGSATAAAAIRVTRAMEAAGVWRPRVLTVVEHAPVAIADMALPAPSLLSSTDLSGESVLAIRRQVSRLGGTAWPFQNEVGNAAAWIVDAARQHQVDLIVLGLGKHGKLARLFGAETAARVCRKSDVPVLAVDHHATDVPRCIVAAVDFGPSSVRAAHEALGLLAAGGRLHLVHVRFAVDGHTLKDPVWERTYALGVKQAFQQLRKDLQRPGVTVTQEFRLGGILESILKTADECEADVIAMGSHSQRVVDRLLLGSTPAHMLRAARCSVLVAPPLP